MIHRSKTFVLALALTVLTATAAGADPNFFFIHVPSSGSNFTQQQIDDGLKEIGKTLEDNWKQGNPGGGEPKVCWVGYAGPWSKGGPNQPNHGGTAANNIGNADQTDNQCGQSVGISYCVLDAVLDKLTGPESECDIVIGLGEGGDTGFCLEEHGGTGTPDPDCNGATPGGPVCTGEGCSGTDWDDPVYGECGDCTFAELVQCAYDDAHEGEEPGTYVPVKPGDGAGNFLCGYFCCWRSSQQQQTTPR